MSTYTSQILWVRGEQNFLDNRSSCKHVLRPDVQFSGDRLPSRAEIDAIHHTAHADCFIANSVKSQVLLEPVYGALG
jgi:organic hydroperoxide reductase OsmC/OhrA